MLPNSIRGDFARPGKSREREKAVERMATFDIDTKLKACSGLR